AHGRQPDPGGRAARPHPARPQAQDGPLRDRLGRGGLSPRRPLACRAVPGVRFGTSFGFDAKSRACSAAPGAAVPAGTKRRLGGQPAPERHFLAGTATYTARSPLGDGWHAVCDPPARRARGQPPEAPVIDRTSVRASVLVVDDERGPRESLRMILSPLYRVTAVANGSDALDALRTTPVDVVTLDLAMPGLRGPELMRMIRSEFPDVELIVITGQGTLESATEGIRWGVADYLQKPFDVMQVTASVYRALTRRRSRTRLVRFLEELGDVVGRDAEVQDILERIDVNPDLRRRLGELLAKQVADFPPSDLFEPERVLPFFE